MDLLNHSRPSWDMKEVAYNHRSMSAKAIVCQWSQTFGHDAYCKLMENLVAFVGLLKFKALIQELKWCRRIHDSVSDFQMPAEGRVFICYVSGILARC